MLIKVVCLFGFLPLSLLFFSVVRRFVSFVCYPYDVTVVARKLCSMVYISLSIYLFMYMHICSAEQHSSGNVFRSCRWPLSLFCASKRVSCYLLSFWFESKLLLHGQNESLGFLCTALCLWSSRSIGISLWNMNMCCILMYLCTCRSYIVKKFSLIKYDRLARDERVKEASERWKAIERCLLFVDCCTHLKTRFCVLQADKKRPSFLFLSHCFSLSGDLDVIYTRSTIHCINTHIHM